MFGRETPPARPLIVFFGFEPSVVASCRAELRGVAITMHAKHLYAACNALRRPRARLVVASARVPVLELEVIQARVKGSPLTLHVAPVDLDASVLSALAADALGGVPHR